MNNNIDKIIAESRNTNFFKDMLLVFAIGVIFCIIATITGCASKKPVVETITVEKETIIHHRDTAIVTEADSASVLALLECDSNYNVVVDKLSTIMGQRINVSVLTGKSDEDSKTTALVVNCHEDSLLNVIDILEKEVREKQTETIIKTEYKKGFFYYSGVALWTILGLALFVFVSAFLFTKLYF